MTTWPFLPHSWHWDLLFPSPELLSCCPLPDWEKFPWKFCLLYPKNSWDLVKYWNVFWFPSWRQGQFIIELLYQDLWLKCEESLVVTKLTKIRLKFFWTLDAKVLHPPIMNSTHVLYIKSRKKWSFNQPCFWEENSKEKVDRLDRPSILR